MYCNGDSIDISEVIRKRKNEIKDLKLLANIENAIKEEYLGKNLYELNDDDPYSQL